MKITVIGAGGIGGTLAARLAAAGHAVAVVARAAHLEALQATGLSFVDAAGPDTGVYRVRAVADTASLGPQDAVFLATKAHQLPAILPQVPALLGASTVVIPAINGLPWWYFQGAGGAYEGWCLQSLDPDAGMPALLPWQRIIGCVLHFAAQRGIAGEVQCTAGRRIILGEPDGSDSPRLRSLAMLLETAGFAVERTRDIRRDIWVKLIGNLSFNPVAALTGYRMDQICADEPVLAVIRAALEEGSRVAAHLGIDVGISAEARIDIARELGSARISMLQDLEAGRSLELEPIVGAVIEIAQRAGIDVPASRMLYALARARARALELPQS